MDTILNQVYESTGRNISVYSDSFLYKFIQQRITDTHSVNKNSYLNLLRDEPLEAMRLLDSLNISYSTFFRNPLDFSIIERFILPSLFQRNGLKSAKSLRIWSAGCADGPEPYSMAIVGEELTKMLSIPNPPMIFATDLSGMALEKARAGVYSGQAIQNVKRYQLESCFVKTGESYSISSRLKSRVEFSHYDLLDPKTTSPPAAIFGGFDLAFCCNLMVYYKPAVHEIILTKLYRSLGDKGFLVVDQAEKGIVKAFKGFRLYSALSNIFVKI